MNSQSNSNNEYLDSKILNTMIVAIQAGISKSDFQKEYGSLNLVESKTWDELEKEIEVFESLGIAVEVSSDFPEVIDTGLREP